MHITIYDTRHNILVQTVGIRPNEQSNTNVTLFRCPKCGSPVAQAVGQVVSITPGLEPTADAITLHKCHDCKEMYTFQTRYTASKAINVTLAIQPGTPNVFYCVKCRSPIARYHSKAVVNEQGAEIVLPAIVPCSRCNNVYALQAIVEA